MAQNEGILGAVKNYIPGMTTSNEEHHKKSSTEEYEAHDIRDTQATSENQQQQSGGGILSYIPGFGGGSSTNQTDNAGAGVGSGTETDANAARTTRSGTVYNQPDDPTTENYGNSGQRAGAKTSDYETAPGSATGMGYTSGTNPGSGTGAGYKSGNTADTGYGRSAAPSAYGNDSTTDSGYGGSKPGIGSAVTTTTGDINHTKTRLSDDEPGRTNKHPSSHAAGGYGHSSTGGNTQPNDSRATDSAYLTKPTTGSSHHHNTPRDTDYAPNTGTAYGTTDSDYAPKTGTNRKTDTGYGTTPGADHVPTAGHQKGGQTTAGYTGNPADGRVSTTTGSGVKGAPIEGENVKGYTVSAPVGTGDVNALPTSGDPSGQVSGAHMAYGPVDVDDRDQTGRGTVGRTSGDGDSSFANVKRNIKNGTEHVVSNQSTSRIQHSSVTQL